MYQCREISRSVLCVFQRPLQVLLPSATGWTTGVSSVLQPADTLRYQSGPAHWHGASLNTGRPTWHDENLTSRPNSTIWWGGELNNNNNKHFLNYVVMSQKYRLPTWHLVLKIPTTRNVTKLRVTRSGCWYSKWFSQRHLLREKQRGTKKSAPTVTAWLLVVCCCCWRQEVDGGNSAGTEGRLLAEFYVEMMLMEVIMLLTFRWCCWC